MSGHSKWANIKHRKGAQDAARSKMFAKLSKEIMVAAIKGGANPNSNPALKLAISKAKSQSMPKKNIENAIAKAMGENKNKNFKEIFYGGNVMGVSFLIQFLTDKPNKASALIQSYFRRHNGTVTSASSVSYVFNRKGILEFDKSLISAEEFENKILTLPIDDFSINPETYLIIMPVTSFSDVKSFFHNEGVEKFITAKITYLPNTLISLDKEKKDKILSFINKLENDDEIQEVCHNLNLE